MSDTLPISESFYSIQGEGKYMGTPAIFLRLKGCNLSCGGKNTLKTGKLDSGATWRCDTIEVWTKGTDVTIEVLIDEWKMKGWIGLLRNGAHLVITGGEPLLWQENIVNLMDYINKVEHFIPFCECETNGTILPDPEVDRVISQYNVSPKLKNSGMERNKRIKKKALHFFSQSKKSSFKFVVSKKKELDEIDNTFKNPFNISNEKMQLMPAADSRAQLLNVSENVVEWCKEKNIGFSSRLHLLLWDKKTGV